MRKLLAILLLCSPAFATTWYATSSTANMSAISWVPTKGASCAGSGTPLVWASRAASDVFNANGCTAITIDADPGANGSVTLTTDATNTSASAPFLCATANNINITATITATANQVAVVATTGSSGTGCNITGTVTGGSAANAKGVADTHTVVTITVTGNVVGGSGSSSAIGYDFTSASGSVTISGNAKGGAAAQGLSISNSTGGSATVTGNCVGSDTTGGAAGCLSVGTTSGGIITLNGSAVAGKFAPGTGNGKFYPAPSSAASAFYYPINSTYTSADIVDASYNVKSPPTFTNVFVAPMAYATNGLKTGCDATAGTGCSNIKNGVIVGPFTGGLPPGGNTGSAH